MFRTKVIGILWMWLAAMSQLVVSAQGDQSNQQLSDDPAFNHQIDWSFFAQANQSLDPEQLAEVALQVAEAERILMRPHHGFTAAEFFAAVLRLAIERQSEAALKTLARSAEQRGDKELGVQIATARKLLGEARSVEPKSDVVPTDIKMAELAWLKSLQNGLQRARIWRERQCVEAIAWASQLPSELPESSRQELNLDIQHTKESLTQTGPASPRVAPELLRLTASSRDRTLFGRWQSGQRILDFDPSGWMEIQAANGNVAVLQYTVDQSLGDPNVWIIDASDRTGKKSRGVIQWLDDDTLVFRGDLGALLYRRLP